MKRVKYQVVVLWECPECHVTWQARHRPRAGADLVCAPGPEQNATVDVSARSGTSHRIDVVSAPGCGVISTSAGRRGGIAPNVSI